MQRVQKILQPTGMEVTSFGMKSENGESWSLYRRLAEQTCAQQIQTLLNRQSSAIKLIVNLTTIHLQAKPSANLPKCIYEPVLTGYYLKI